MLGPAQIAHGPMLLGFFFNAILYGVMILQTHVYFVRISHKDPAWMRLFVLSIFILDSLNTVFDFVYLYTSLILHFDDPPYLQNATWVFATDPALTAVIAAMVQLFFAWRVKILTDHNRYLYLIVVACAFAGLVGGIATAVSALIESSFVKLQAAKGWVILWLAADCIGDFCITTILVWHLRRRKTGFAQTDFMVDRIISGAVHTGLLTSVCAILDLVFYLATPTGLHLIFNWPLCKLYTNSLISSLNCRAGWGYGEDGPAGGNTGSDGTYSEDKIASLPKYPRPVPPRPPPLALMVIDDADLETALPVADRDGSSNLLPVARTHSKNSESTAVSLSSAPRKDSTVSYDT